jgi:hypothetical protein
MSKTGLLSVSIPIPTLTGGVSSQPDALRMPQQAEVSTNAVASVVEGLRKRPPSEYQGVLPGFPSGEAATHVAKDTSGDYLIATDGSALQVYDIADPSTTKTIRNNQGGIASGADFAYLGTTNPRSDLKFLTLGDYTVVLNSTKTTAESTETVSTWDASIGILQVNSGAYSSLYEVEITDPTNNQSITVQVETWSADGTSPTGAAQSVSSAESSIRTGAIAKALYELLTNGTTGSTYIGQVRVIGGISGGLPRVDWDVQHSGSTISIQRLDGTPFEMRVTDDRGDTLMKTAHRSEQLFSDLPVHAKVGMAVEILGNPEEVEASYWVAFRDTQEDKQISDWSDGYWEETAKPGINKSFDPSTMPHVIFRQANGEWQFSPLDGHTYLLSGTSYTIPKWADRIAGDKEYTNKNPKFVGKNIRDLCFHEGRMGLLSDDALIFSETREPFNFFRVSVLNILDSDRIELAADQKDDAKLTHVAPLGSDVVVFSNGRQYVVRSEGPLTPSSASFIQGGQYDTSPTSMPLRRKDALVTSNIRGGKAAIYEFRVAGERRPSLDRLDLTAVASDYIENLWHLSASPQADMMVGVSDKTPDTLWVYTDYMNRGERVMQAWQKWVWPNNPSVVSVWFEESILYVVLAYGSSTRLLKMDCAYHAEDPAGGRVHLDCRVDEDDITTSLTSGLTLDTVVAMPFTPTADIRCVEKRTFKEIRVLSVDTANNTVTLDGDHQNKDLFLGSPFSFRHDLSKIYRSDQNQAPVVGQDLFLDSGVINYQDSSEFDIVITGRDGTTYRTSMMGKFLGDGTNYQNFTLSSGSLRFGVRGRADERTISFQSTSPGPLQLVTADLAARITRARGSR